MKTNQLTNDIEFKNPYVLLNRLSLEDINDYKSVKWNLLFIIYKLYIYIYKKKNKTFALDIYIYILLK